MVNLFSEEHYDTSVACLPNWFSLLSMPAQLNIPKAWKDYYFSLWHWIVLENIMLRLTQLSMLIN